VTAGQDGRGKAGWTTAVRPGIKDGMGDPTPEPEAPAPDDWHLKLFEKSLPLQARLAEIASMVGRVPVNQTWLDVSGDGVSSGQLRRLGGTWHTATPDDASAASTLRLVGERVERIREGRLPFGDSLFDGVVILDQLERMPDDALLIAECHRVLKPAGRLLVHAPHLKKRALLRPARRLLGMTDEALGRVRPGYTESVLFDLLKDGFDVQEARSYGRFFVEALDLLAWRGERPLSLAAGADAGSLEKLVLRRARLYPVFQFAAGMDTLLGLTKGYRLIVRARRRPWRPRRAPVLADGRSIAEAALGGKIGTAAPF